MDSRPTGKAAPHAASIRGSRSYLASSWCHAHHIIAWQDGGPTVLDNLVLLCGYHHRLVHRGEWAIVMADDGHPDFLAATWIDPDRRPLRNRAPEVVLN